jgi:hypothetical protein
MQREQSKRTTKYKNPDEAISVGVLVQTKFQRGRYPEVKAAAQAAGMPVTTWIRFVILQLLDERKKSTVGK